jgi:AcrR family transcriptional regulator
MSAAERETGEAILAAAAGLFGERGYKGTTTRAIAERAGVNEVTIFRHFKNKQGVLIALARSWAASMAGFAVVSVPEPEDTRGTLETLAHLEVAQAEAFGTVAMRLAMDAASSPEVAEVTGGGPGANFAGLAEYLAQRQAAGDLRADIDARVMAEAFFALTSTLVMSRQVLSGGAGPYDMAMEQVGAQALEIYMNGVAVRRETA